MSHNPLARTFYQRYVVDVAHDLVGHRIQFHGATALITETEAYRGADDPASHAYKHLTPRNAPMFGQAGVLYVYLIYGMHFCLNICAEAEGQAAAVLIRGVCSPQQHYNGPGKSCRFLQVNKQHNQIDIIDHPHIMVSPGIVKPDVSAGTRIGIRQGTDLPWRFTLADHHVRAILDGSTVLHQRDHQL